MIGPAHADTLQGYGRCYSASITHQTKDLALYAATQPADSDELENTLLHVVQTVVVIVQHLREWTGTPESGDRVFHIA